MPDEQQLIIESPVGLLRLSSRGEALIAIEFGAEGRAQDLADQASLSPPLQAAIVQLGEYFAGARRAFELPLAPRGTEFQQAVWEQLALIPFGETTTYGALARAIGRPGSSRAVGAANGANPLPIVLPCHRVVGADRTLTGFGGGLPIKRQLLTLEGLQLEGDKVLPPPDGQGLLPI